MLLTIGAFVVILVLAGAAMILLDWWQESKGCIEIWLLRIYPNIVICIFRKEKGVS